MVDEIESGADVHRLEQSAGGSLARSAQKFLLLVLLLGAVLLIIHFTPAKEFLGDVERLKAQLLGLGVWSPLIFFLGCALLTAVGFPRLGLTFAAGLLFGAAYGGLLALGATLLGSYATFCLARWSGTEWARRIASRSRRVEFAMSNQTVTTVFLVRQLPITNVVLNLLLSLSDVGHGSYLIGSLLGFLPSAAVALVAGSSIGKTSTAISFFQFGLAAIIVVATALTAWRLKRKWSESNAV
jgi:uncharacterized membrane protein YdjX (TVP38/TMEM64 family)